MEIVCTAILNKPLFTRLHLTVSSVTLSQKRVIRGVRVELTHVLAWGSGCRREFKTPTSPHGNSKGRSEQSIWNDSVQTGGVGGQEQRERLHPGF